MLKNHLKIFILFSLIMIMESGFHKSLANNKQDCLATFQECLGTNKGCDSYHKILGDPGRKACEDTFKEGRNSVPKDVRRRKSCIAGCKAWWSNSRCLDNQICPDQ